MCKLPKKPNDFKEKWGLRIAWQDAGLQCQWNDVQPCHITFFQAQYKDTVLRNYGIQLLLLF
jgi:hypothetical protein